MNFELLLFSSWRSSGGGWGWEYRETTIWNPSSYLRGSTLQVRYNSLWYEQLVVKHMPQLLRSDRLWNVARPWFYCNVLIVLYCTVIIVLYCTVIIVLYCTVLIVLYCTALIVLYCTVLIVLYCTILIVGFCAFSRVS